MGRVVWIFNHYAITPEFSGGTRHFELAQALVQKGWQVVIFASNFIHMDSTTVQTVPGKKYRIDCFEGLHFVWIKTSRYLRNDWRRLISMFSYCLGSYSVSKDLLRRKVISKPDVIVGSTVHPFAPLMSAFIARRLHVPFILEIRDLWPQTFIDMGAWRPYSPMSIVFRCIERKSVRYAERIITLSPETATYLTKCYNIGKEDIHYIPNGVAVSRFSLEAVVSDSGSFRLVYLGGIETVHGLGVIFEAMKVLHTSNGTNIEFFIYGDGKLKSYFQMMYPLPNVKWMGSVQKQRVPEVLQAADAFFLSTANVSYGSENKLYEYMAAAKPIISSAAGNHNSIIGKIGAGMCVSPGKVEELVSAIQRLYHMSRSERIQMGIKGRNYAIMNHDWQVLATRIEAAIGCH